MATKTTKKPVKRKTRAKKVKKRTSKKRAVKKEPAPKTLTVKQQRFIEEYCVDFNGTQAAIRAGYSRKTAYNIGHENVRKPEISLAIKKRLDNLSMSTEEALQRLTRFARGSMEDFVRVNEEGEPSIVIPLVEDGVADPDALSLVKKMKIRKNTSTSKDGEEFTTTTTEFELEDRQAAIDKMLKARRVYTEGANIKVDFGENVTINIVPG